MTVGADGCCVMSAAQTDCAGCCIYNIITPRQTTDPNKTAENSVCWQQGPILKYTTCILHGCDKNTTKMIQILVFLCLCVVHVTACVCAHTDVSVYLWGLFAARRGGSAARGGQRSGAGLRGALLTGRGHLVQAVLPGRVGLHTAGGRRVLNSKHIKLYYTTQKQEVMVIYSFIQATEISRKSVSVSLFCVSLKNKT